MAKTKKICLVTGASGAIGAEIVSSLLADDFVVIAQDIRPIQQEHDNLYHLQADLERYVTDTNFETDINQQIDKMLPDGKLDLLVNNAAVQILGGTEQLSRSDWQQTINVNLLAPFLLTKSLLRYLEQAKGHVVNISSIHARQTKSEFVAYATSKAALSALTRSMAVDLGNRVCINAIEPAAIDTPMLREGFSTNSEAFKELQRYHPQQRIGSPSDVANLVKLMVLGKVEFLHGSCIALDGAISSRLHDPV